MVESAVEPKNKSQEKSLPLVYSKDEAYHLIQNPVQLHATQLWHILSEKDTALTYQKAGAQTWAMLKRVFLLLSFLLTSLVALSVWFCGIGFHSGWRYRQWLEEEHPTLDELVAVFFKTLLWPLEYAFKWSEQFVKKYFGWEFKKSGHSDTPGNTENTPTS